MLGGDTVEKVVGARIAALEKAVEAKDRAAFATAFDKLTAGCNSCHQALDHAFIVIQRPTRSLQQSVFCTAKITPRPRQRAAASRHMSGTF